MKTAMILATVALTAFAHAATVAGLEQYGSLTLVDEIVCASDSTHQLREYPSGRSSSEAVIGEQCRVMRHVAKSETSNGQECGAYVAWRLGQGNGLVPKAAYLLVAEYPDNAPRSFTLGNRGTGSRTGVHTGFTVGDALNPPYITQHPEAYPLPLSGEFKRIEQVMYLMEKPESLDGNSRLVSATDGFDVYFALYPAEDAPDSVGLALKSIKLYKIDDASALETAVKYPADGLPRRFVTWREEMADVGGQEAFTDPIDYYRTKAKLMKVLGFNCASRDLLEFGHCQYWDPDYNGYSNWMNYDGAKKGYWESTVDAFGAEGHYVMPYYEYTGARGGDGLGYQKLCKTLYYDTKKSEDFIESVSAAAGALVDITSPEAVAEFKKILDCTIIRFKDRAAFRGAWLRNRGSMPVSFHENTVARFNADTGRNVTRKNIADAGRSSDLYRAYMNWWYAKRAAFLEAMRDYLRQNGVADAQAYFDNDITEPGRFWESWRNNVAYDTDYRYSGKTWAEYVGSTSWSVDSIVNTAQTWWQYGIKGEYPTYNALEHYHGCPTDDPETYQSKSGVALTLPFSAVYTQIPQAGVGSFRNADGRLFIARHYSLNEDAIFTEQGEWDKPLGYFTSDSEHAGRASMLPQLWAMALNDPTDIGYLYGAAMETAYAPAMREFNRNFLALPAKKGTVMQGGAWGALQTVRRYDTDKGVTYWALVNTSADPVTAEFTLSSNASELSRVAASVDGTVYPVTQGKVSLTMQPMQLLALTSEIPADSPYAPSVAEPEQFDGYELCWQEEFNGTGKPDSAKWGYENGLVRNHEAQCYTRDNATVSDGRLVIEARKERTKNPNYTAGSDSWNTKNEYADYSSSSIITAGKAHFLYGKYVFRARIPTSRGMWPCMWFLGTKWEWPASGEIDVQEFYWKGNTPTLLCNLFWSGNSHVTERSIASLGDSEWSQKYHTWVMDWDKDYIRIYLDGALLNETALDNTINYSCEEAALHKSPFRIPQYILLDLPMGGDAGGAIDDSALPTQLEVDYVRVYRKIGTTDGLQPLPVVDPVPGVGPEYETSSDSPASYDGYRLEWHDEFTGTGAPSSEHWNVATDNGKSAANVSCTGGALVIQSAKDGSGNFSSGSVNTYGKHDHMKGRIEFRARIPVENGLRPTSWILSRNRDYPAGGMYEILDSLYIGGAPSVAMWSTWAADEDWYSQGIFDDIEQDPKWAAKFHTWRLDWDDSAMKIYLDGTLFHSKSTNDMKNNGVCPFIDNGNQFYLGFNLDFVNADLSDASAGKKYEIDWVRYYVPGEEPATVDPYSPDTGAIEQFDGYELSWSDEFNGTGKPDASNWDYELGFVRNDEDQCYTRDNATMANGRLVIEARKEHASFNGRTGNYSSSSIVTKGNRHFLYGKYVFRARIPTSQGTWPCMWLMGKNYTWPSGGEIDVQEAFWQHNEPYLKCNLCWNGSGSMWDTRWNSLSRSIASFNDPEWGNKYHTWVMDWDYDYIRIYLDGELLREQALSGTLNEGEWGEGTQGKSPFREPQYILLDLPVGGISARPIDDSKLPAQLEVDYVRVYRKVGTTDGLQPADTFDTAPGEGADYVASTSAPVAPTGYTMAWHDEFDSGSAPSGEHWNVSQGSTATVADGLLKMPSDGNTWAYLETKGKHLFSKGIYEVRARIPIAKGLQSYVFTESANGGSPYGYFELLDTRYISGSRCIAMWNTWNAGNEWYDRQLTMFTKNDPKWAAKFHVWKYVVTDEKIDLYIDDSLFYTRTTASMLDNGACPFGSETKPHYFAIGQGYNAEAIVDTTALPQTFEVDYVRCYVPGVDPGDDPDDPPTPSASEFTWTFPETGTAPTAEICTFLYGKTWAYTFEMDDNPLGAYTIAKPLFDRLTATDAPTGVQGGTAYSMPGTLGIIANTIDNMKPSVNITVAQMKELIAAGWSISNHGYWHTGIHWDPEKANDEAMYRREFFWGQFFISHYIWDGQRSCTAMVFPNGDTGYGPYLEQYGILVGTVCASTPHNVLRSGTNGSKVNFLDCGRSNLDEGNWRDHSDLDPLWLLPENFEEGDWFIDFTHGISEPGKGTYAAVSNRLEYIRTKWGAGGADNVWLATTDRVAQYRKAAEAATVSVTGGKVTVSLPETVIQSALTLKISGIPASAQLTAPEGGRLYRNAAGDVFLTTPVIGEKITNHPAGNLVKAHEAEIKVSAGSVVAQEITFDEPVKFAGMRLLQFGDLPSDGFDINLRLVTANGEVPFNFAKYNKYVTLGNAWGTWRLFPQLPDEEALPIIGVRYNAVQAFKKVEIWAVGDEGTDDPGDDPDDPPTPPAEQPDKTMQAWFSRTVSPEQIVGGTWRTPEGDELFFEPTAASREGDAVYVDVEATFPQVAASALPSAARGQAAVSAADGALYVHGSAGWTRLANATVSQGVAKSLRVEFDYSSQSAPRVRVWEHGTDSYTELKDAYGNSWFACSGSKKFLASLAFGGDGTIGDFAGYCENGPREIGTIEVPSFVGPDGVTRGGVGMKDVGGNAVFAVTIANAQKGAYYTAFTCTTLSSSAADWVAEKTSSPAPLDGLLELDVEASDAPSKFVKIVATAVSIGAGTRLSDIE